MSRRTVAVLALTGVLALAGCSGDDSDDGSAPSASTSASPSAADTLVQAGLRQLEAGDDESARTTFQNVLDLDPDNVYAHYNLGQMAQDAGDDETAIKRYDAALATDSDFTSALYNKAILRERSDLEEAVGLYRRALDVDPDLAPAHMRLGFALLHLGQTAEAEEHLAAGVELDPSLKDVGAPSYD